MFSKLSEDAILAIDLGTSGPKVALASPHGEILAWEFEHVPLLLLPGGGAEQRPEDWWQAIKKATHRLIQHTGVAARQIAAISCTSQWSGTLAVDRNGNPLMNALIWMDARGAPYVRRITGGSLSLEGYSLPKLWQWIRLTGGAPSQSGKDSIAHILYIQRRHPEVYASAYKFLEPKDYINMRLTGEFAASYDSIGLYWLTDNRNLGHIDYSPKLLRYSQVEKDKLPSLGQSIEILGTLTPTAAEELGLQTDTKVVFGSPDVQSAAIGSGAVMDFHPHLYIGTSSWLCCHTPTMKADILHNIGTIPSSIPNRYLVLNEQECAGACLDYLLRQVLYPQELSAVSRIPPDYFVRLNQLAEGVPPGSNRVIFTPWLYGERTPVDDHLVRGGFFNLSLRTSQAHLIRAVFEGVAYNSRWLLTYVEKFVGHRMDEIRFVGGGAQSALWSQIHADVFGRTVHQVKQPILVNVRGAAFLAAVALGWLSFSDIPHHVPVNRIYQPRPEYAQIYSQLFQEYVQIYKKNQPIYTRLNRMGFRRAKASRSLHE